MPRLIPSGDAIDPIVVSIVEDWPDFTGDSASLAASASAPASARLLRQAVQEGYVAEEALACLGIAAEAIEARTEKPLDFSMR
jgi:hypothetical protein